MSSLRRLARRLAGSILRRRREAEMIEEIRVHLELQTEEYLRQGLPPDEARRRARLRFGGTEAVIEGVRDEARAPIVEALRRDVSFAWKSLRRSPGFTLSVVASIALGIGATTAIFSVADAVLLRELPYSDTDRLVHVSLGGAISAPLHEAFAEDATGFEHTALFAEHRFDLTGDGEPEKVPGARVSAGLFELLGVRPQLGRTFAAAEDTTGAERVVILGDGVWRRRFGADPGVLGRQIEVDHRPATVIGVMPRGFRFPLGPELPPTADPLGPAELWRPMRLAEWERGCIACFNFSMLARLQQGTERPQAAASARAVVRRLDPEAATFDPRRLEVRALGELVRARARDPILALLGAVALALLIACANVSNLLLARGLARQSELSLRLALGGTPRRLVSQLLAEASLLALGATLVALPLAFGGVELLVRFAPHGIPRLDDAGVDTRVLAFAFALTLVSALLLGTAPAAMAARRQPAELLRDGSQRGPTPRGSRLRTTMVVAQIGASVVLVAASASLARSYLTVASTPLGFATERLLTLRTSLPSSRYDEPGRARAIVDLAVSSASLAGVEAAAAVSALPLTGDGEGWGLIATDSPAAANPRLEDMTMARARSVTPGYFATIDIPIVAGRDFEPADRDRPVAIVSALAARRLWPNLDDVTGRQIAAQNPLTVIGVVADTHASGPDAEILPYLYVPVGLFAPEEFAVVLRTRGEPLALVAAARAEVRRLAPDSPVEVTTMRRLAADWTAPRRFQTALTSLVALFALTLAAIGIFGLLSYSVAARSRELGIRIALGASSAGIVATVVRRAALLAVGGILVGLVAALATLPMLRSLLYGIEPFDPTVFAAATLVLLAAAGAAALGPAWRAATLDPVASLRAE